MSSSVDFEGPHYHLSEVRSGNRFSFDEIFVTPRDVWIKFTQPMLLILLVVVIVVVYLEKRERQRRRMARTRNDETPILPIRIAKLSPQERYQYFEYIFEQNGNHFLVPGEDLAEKSEEDEQKMIIFDDSSEHDVEEGILRRRLDQVDNQKIVVVVDDDENDRTCVSETSKVKYGECIICFEAFQQGEELVCSETCDHLYHKDCYLEYLTKQRTSKKELQRLQDQSTSIQRPDWHPSCPICRRRFCTLIEPPKGFYEKTLQ